MNSRIETARFLLSPPGETIQEHIDYMGMSQAELAERMGRPKEKLNDIIKGREPITTATAFQLENVLGVPATFWMNSEKSYRHELYLIQQQEELENQKDWLEKFPLKELKKYGYLPDTREKHKLVDALLKFFGVASTDEWAKIYVSDEVSVAFRISLAHTQNPYAISAWLRMGELQTGQMEIADFDKKKFRETLYTIRELAFIMPEDFALQLQQLCAQCGVAVVYTPGLPKAPVSGCCRWFHNQPVIQLSGRFRTNDHFWFTFFHEAAHIILHGKKDIFLEDVQGAELDNEKEHEANTLAARILIDETRWQQIVGKLPLTSAQIIEISGRLRVAPGIITGRLQHEKRVKQSFGNELKTGIDLFGDKFTP
jgi:HTH-type transcriptional regulator / antitoxin HigA